MGVYKGIFICIYRGGRVKTAPAMSVDDLCNVVVSCLAASKQDKVEQRFTAHQI